MNSTIPDEVAKKDQKTKKNVRTWRKPPKILKTTLKIFNGLKDVTAKALRTRKITK